MTRILLVHLSDIHVGSIKNAFYKSTSLQAGWNGHDPFLCRLLQDALLNMPHVIKMSDKEKPYLIVSGDLSCIGLRTDFALAHSYLNLKVLLDGLVQTPVGLQDRAVPLWTVPGNHDHWGGTYSLPPPAHDPSIFPDMFLQTPWPDTLRSLDGKLELDLFGIDSNSGLAGTVSNANYRAGGQLSPAELDNNTGLEKLLMDSKTRETALKKKGVHQARAIICHHSFNNKGQWQPTPSIWAKVKAAGQRAWKWFMSYLIGQCPDPLDQQSVSDLLNLTWQYGVKVVMTGHTHYFWEEKHSSQTTPPSTTWELRSSTSLQGPAQDAVQGFFVHEIRLDGNPPAPVWHYLKYQYSLAKQKFLPERDAQGQLAWIKAD